MNNNFKDIMQNRSSIKSFDPTVKIPRAEMLAMIDEAVTAPSSVNLQPWRFVVVDTPAGKEKLRPVVKFNLNQNETSAAMVVLFGDLECYREAETIYGRAVQAGYMPADIKEQLMGMFMPSYQNESFAKMNDIVKVDSSLAAMQFMLVARAHGYETNPIGGFDAEKIARVLDLDEKRYVPVLIMAIGKQGDYQPFQTIRLAADEVTTFK
ncbi:nitroreductase family protein [Ligilactobacillus ceti]|uniref:Transcription regulator n=1 Tax=Ligilactobacillus ceti DSM 22408 TaxID=1122146 RepID=A0A0R2KHG1_9LACO|nr:nitroreductase family protein [Ligilactobacillus ceti]KRN88785.1 transcription regulator [Ligilactobacillus ceti DSM 22408]